MKLVTGKCKNWEFLIYCNATSVSLAVAFSLQTVLMIIKKQNKTKQKNPTTIKHNKTNNQKNPSKIKTPKKITRTPNKKPCKGGRCRRDRNYPKENTREFRLKVEAMA